MGTDVRPELSGRNEYWIGRHRYYELKHFCLQYPLWKRALTDLDGTDKRPAEVAIFTNAHGDPTAAYAMARAYFSGRTDMVEKAAAEAEPELSCYILRAVTEGLSYDHLRAGSNIPCCKEVYYRAYRRFFWLLHRARK